MSRGAMGSPATAALGPHMTLAPTRGPNHTISRAKAFTLQTFHTPMRLGLRACSADSIPALYKTLTALTGGLLCSIGACPG
jgi:hypothetical protein